MTDLRYMLDLVCLILLNCVLVYAITIFFCGGMAGKIKKAFTAFVNGLSKVN